MKKYIFVAALIASTVLTSCTLSPMRSVPTSPVVSPTPVVPVVPVAAGPNGEMRVSANEVKFNSGALNLETRMSYLDSENKVYKEATAWELLGKFPKNIVYFYPKDGTPNCTIQAIDFSRLQKEFNALGVGILGVSKDNLDSHREFALRNELTIPLLRDDKSMLLGAYGALGPAVVYGNWVALTDIVRSTYLVDSKWVPLAAWTTVSATGHAERVLEYVKSLAK